MRLGGPTESRGPIIRYGLASDDDREKDSTTTRESHQHILPPEVPANLLDTILSSKFFFISMELGSNYAGMSHGDSSLKARQNTFVWRGIGKVAVLLLLASGLLNPSLRVLPVLVYFQN